MLKTKTQKTVSQPEEVTLSGCLTGLAVLCMAIASLIWMTILVCAVFGIS